MHTHINWSIALSQINIKDLVVSYSLRYKIDHLSRIFMRVRGISQLIEIFPASSKRCNYVDFSWYGATQSGDISRRRPQRQLHYCNQGFWSSTNKSYKSQRFLLFSLDVFNVS